MKEEEISYIAKRYHEGKFSVDKGWKRLNLVTTSKFRSIRIAAAVASAIVLTASAAFIYHKTYAPQPTVEVQQPVAPSPKDIIRVIDFDNAQLPTVIEKIKEVYGVEVINLPENAADYRLSLHFEGNPVVLVETINDILDTNMAVGE